MGEIKLHFNVARLLQKIDSFVEELLRKVANTISLPLTYDLFTSEGLTPLHIPNNRAYPRIKIDAKELTTS